MTIKASDHWPSLGHALWYIIGPPRGLLWIVARCAFVIIPQEITSSLLHHRSPVKGSSEVDEIRSKTTSHLDLFSRVFVRTIRYTLGDRDMERCRFLFFLIDRIHYYSCSLRGYTVDLISDSFDNHPVHGVWLGDDQIPSHGSPDWENTLVILYVHGMYIS